MKCSHFLRVSFTFNFRYLLFLGAAKKIYIYFQFIFHFTVLAAKGGERKICIEYSIKSIALLPFEIIECFLSI